LSAYGGNMSVYENEEWTINLKKFVDLIKDDNADVSEYAPNIVSWFGKPRLKRFEPYCALYRNALDADKDGKSSNPSLWGSRLKKIEYIHNLCMLQGKSWAKIISSETIAHRWLDMEYHLGMKEYRDKWIFGYDTSHAISLEMSPKDRRYFKFVDSSLYWKAHGFCKFSEFDIAKTIFCQIAERKGKRYDYMSTAFNRKLRVSKLICEGKKHMPGQDENSTKHKP
jgi:hypothetical protein